MSKIKVPEFENIQEFEKWADKLKDKEIQSWSTKDWLKVYEQLDKIPMSGTAFEKDCLNDGLIKLYRNYRLEEADFRSMREIGRTIGHNLAEQKIGFDLASVNVKNQFTDGARESFAHAADKAVYRATSYPKAEGTPLNNYGMAGSKISVFDAASDPSKAGGAMKLNDYQSLIRISDEAATDVYGTTPFHESVHAQMQTLRAGQKEALEKMGIKPQEAFSDDFYKLLQYNDKYYVNNTKSTTLYGDLERRLESGEITAKEFDKLNSRQVFRGYAKQPMETQAELIGTYAEHYYRQETGQLSERAARAFTDTFGTPQWAQYNKSGGVDLGFHVENKERMDNLIKTFVDDETAAKLTLNYDEAHRTYKVTVPQDFATKQAFEHSAIASKFSVNLGVLPTKVDYSDAGKVVMQFNENADYFKEIFEHNRFGKLSEEALANMEIKPLEGGGCTITIPNSAEKSQKLISEMSVLSNKVNAYNAQWMQAVDDFNNGKPAKITCSHIPDGEDLTYFSEVELDVKTIGKDVKLPAEITMKKVPDGVDLSSAERVVISGDRPTIGNNVKFPKEVEMNVIPAGADLSSAEKVILNGQCAIEVGENVKLPKEVTVKYAHNSLDLSSAESVVFDGTPPGLNCKLPKDVEVRNTFMTELPNHEIKFSGECSIYGRQVENPIDLSKCDFSQAEKVELGNCKITAETKLPAGEKVAFSDMVEITDKSALEQVLKSDMSKVSLLELPSQDLMKGMEYPKNTVISFADNSSCYVPNEEALNKFTSQHGNLPDDVKIIGPKDVAERTVAQEEEKAALKTTEKAVINAAEKGAVNSATKQAVKKTLGTQAKDAALKVNKLYDDTFDKYVEKMMKMDTPKWVKSVDNAMAKPIHMTAEQMQKLGEAFVKTPTGAAIQKEVMKSCAEIGGEAALKSAAKKIPLVCVGIACYMAKDRFEKGEYISGTAEVVSGVAACVPVVGTAVSLGIDVAVLASDLGTVIPQSIDYEFKEQKTYMPDATRVVNQRAEMELRQKEFEQRQKELKKIKKENKATDIIYNVEQAKIALNNDPLAAAESTSVQKPIIVTQQTRTRELTDSEAEQVLNEKKKQEALRRYIDKYSR